MLGRFKLPLASLRNGNSSGRSRRPYIIPTGFGFTFGCLAFLQLVMAISSQNNLIYLFVLSEISVALTSMFFTNYNVYRCYLQQITHDDLFARETNWLHIALASQDQKKPQQMLVRWNFSKEEFPVSDNLTCEVSWAPKRRGYQKIPRLIIESKFPFGLLRSWKIVRQIEEIIVFPERKGSDKFPSSAIDRNSLSNQGLFRDLRTFQSNDSIRRIDWRASQRLQQILVRRFEDFEISNLEFNWEQTSHLNNTEERISQLALWVERADKSLASFELNLPGWESGVGSGKEHVRKCYVQLAIWQIPAIKSARNTG